MPEVIFGDKISYLFHFENFHFYDFLLGQFFIKTDCTKMRVEDVDCQRKCSSDRKYH